MSLNPLDNPGSVFELELLYPNPSSRRTKDGPRYFVRFEVDKAAHDEFMASREMNLRLLARCVVLPDTDEEAATKALAEAPAKEKRPPKAKEPVTPNGRLWQILDQYGFHNRPDVRAWLGCASVSENDAKRFLRMKFNVESRKDVSATRLLDEMGYYNTEIEPNALDGAITFVQSLYNE